MKKIFLFSLFLNVITIFGADTAQKTLVELIAEKERLKAELAQLNDEAELFLEVNKDNRPNEATHLLQLAEIQEGFVKKLTSTSKKLEDVIKQIQDKEVEAKMQQLNIADNPK